MATRTVVCPECDSPLSPGRFACPSCGALVAAVATMSRSFMPAETALPPELARTTADEPPEAPITAPVAAADEPVQATKAKAVAPTRRAKSPPRAAKPDADAHVVTQQPDGPPAEQAPVSWAVDASELGEARPSSPPSPPSWPEHPAWPPQRAVDAVAQPVEPSVTRVPAGSYLPPSAVLPPAEALPMPGSVGSNGSGNGSTPRERNLSVSTSLRLRLGEGPGPLGMPADVPARVVVLGAGIAALGFLLPWADIVIGSGSIGGYLEQWGLAGPGHVLILTLIVGLAILALVAEHLPRWFRLGLPSIAVACLLTGLVWPYLAGPFDASIGVYVVAIGALLMIAGGLLDRVATRHAESPTTV